MFSNKRADDKTYQRLREVIGWANDFVKLTGYLAGTENLSIADLAASATYCTIRATKVIDLTGYRELNAWYEKMSKSVKNFQDINEKPAKVYGDFYQSQLKNLQ